jgi:CHAD domain-containing protein
MKSGFNSEEIGAACSKALEAFLRRAFRKQCCRYRKAFKRCQRDFSENSVHELRVETRRMLALGTLLRAMWRDDRLAEIDRCLKRMFKRLSRLRDTHVQLMFVEEAQERFPELAKFHKALAKREVRLTRRLAASVDKFPLRRVQRLVRSVRKNYRSRGKRTSSHHNEWSRVCRHLDNGFLRVTKLRSEIDPQDSVTIHRVRVAFKKFRYLVELLQSMLTGVTARQIEAMHEYQSMMGEIQDVETLQAALDEYVSKKKSRLGAHLHFRDYLRKRRAALVRTYLHHADRLDSFWPPRSAPAPKHRRQAHKRRTSGETRDTARG